MATSEASISARLGPMTRRARGRTRAAQAWRLAAVFLAPAAAFFLLLIAYPLAQVIWTAFHYVNRTPFNRSIFVAAYGPRT
jgi:ABC-type sugar transport system permease subunit